MIRNIYIHVCRYSLLAIPYCPCLLAVIACLLEYVRTLQDECMYPLASHLSTLHLSLGFIKHQ